MAATFGFTSLGLISVYLPYCEAGPLWWSTRQPSGVGRRLVGVRWRRQRSSCTERSEKKLCSITVLSGFCVNSASHLNKVWERTPSFWCHWLTLFQQRTFRQQMRQHHLQQTSSSTRPLLQDLTGLVGKAQTEIRLSSAANVRLERTSNQGQDPATIIEVKTRWQKDVG